MGHEAGHYLNLSSVHFAHPGDPVFDSNSDTLLYINLMSQFCEDGGPHFTLRQARISNPP
jgi:hypothetical protein